MGRRAGMAVLLAGIVGCVPEPPVGRAFFDEVEDVRLDAIGPSVLVPGSTLVLEGSGFLPELAGPTTLVLSGALDGKQEEITLEALFVDYDRLEVAWPGHPAEGLFMGTAQVRTPSSYDGKEHVSNRLTVDLQVVQSLIPGLSEVEDGGTHVNDPVIVRGGGLLLGGAEGQTFARVEGCFRAGGSGTCHSVGPVEIPVVPWEPLERAVAGFPFAPEIAGIEPGRFEGELLLVNRHADGTETRSGSLPLKHGIGRPVVREMAPRGVSLGQIVQVRGGGFVGPGPGDPTAVTLLELDGRFQGAEGGFNVVLTLVGELQGGMPGELGSRVHYVVNEEDALGRLVDVRRSPGTFTGTLRPVVAWQDSVVEGEPMAISVELRPVKQVVWLKLQPSFVESLRQFGLRAARGAVVQRIVDVIERDYAGVNLEVRLEQPDDFALYSVVELSGPDPNGLGLLGYDNTPGKDVGNLRLHDRIGGVNALTQLDGYPGFGGVFLDSLFAYSAHPPGRVGDPGLVDPDFDRLFDPVRPDVPGGQRVSEREAQDLAPIEDNTTCPASGRRMQVACAIFALGNLVGTTTSHEIAHSLGLADPDGEAFHNTGDWDNAIMDAGSQRTFQERAEIEGQGPGRFCRSNYAYLREILPTDLPDPLPEREDCY